MPFRACPRNYSVLSVHKADCGALEHAKRRFSTVSRGLSPSAPIPGTQLVGEIFEVDNLRFANHSIGGLLIDMRRRAEGHRAGWLRDLFDD